MELIKGYFYIVVDSKEVENLKSLDLLVNNGITSLYKNVKNELKWISWYVVKGLGL